MTTSTSARPVSLPVGDILSRAWTLSCRHFPLFLVTLILSWIVSRLVSLPLEGTELMTALASGGGMQESVLIPLLMAFLMVAVWVWIIAWVIEGFFSVVNYRMYLDAADLDKPNLPVAVKGSFRPLLMYLGTSLVLGIATAFASMLCLVPGIYLWLRWIFVPVIVVDHPEWSFGEVCNRSWDLTKGHVLDLLLLVVVMIGINIIGLLCCCVGILFTLIISHFMLVTAYRMLSPREGGEPAPGTEAPQAPTPENLMKTEVKTDTQAEDQTRNEGGYNRSEK
ncbi:MAG: hypothetical protein NC388_09885 [Clostridium sp.]|nr:hypothetical protein [Clostridium sp.]